MKEEAKDVCFGKSEDLLAFHQEVFKYRFKDQPNYNLLRKILKDLMNIETNNDTKIITDQKVSQI